MQPRLIRLRDTPAYLGMDKNRFNNDVRPALIEIPIGDQGVAFDRLDLDAWVDDYIACNGRPAQRQKGLKTRTINYGLQLVRHILNLAASEWLDEHGLTWLAAAPKIKLFAEMDKRKPYPLSWEEQDRLLKELPPHLVNMSLFAVNTGCREICKLRWNWEVPVLGLGYSVFLIPCEHVKNREERLVVLNEAARAVIEKMRGQHPEFVFTYNGKPVSRMLRTAWKKARVRAGLPQVRVHDLKHTFGRRLRAAGVSFEDRQDLLGHKSGRITTHYSAAELSNLIEAASKACAGKDGPVLTLLRRADVVGSRKSRVIDFAAASRVV